MKVHLCHLSNGRDTYVGLITPEAFAWIGSEPQPIEPSTQLGLWTEKSPKGEIVRVTVGSYDNDRAMHACFREAVDDRTFDNAVQAMKYAQKCSYEVDDETYEGYVY